VDIIKITPIIRFSTCNQVCILFQVEILKTRCFHLKWGVSIISSGHHKNHSNRPFFHPQSGVYFISGGKINIYPHHGF
jgi:hypothetical protein